MTETPNLDWWAEHFKSNQPETFCERYPSLGHPMGDDGICVGCGKRFAGETPGTRKAMFPEAGTTKC
jgi:hypothetical protein